MMLFHDKTSGAVLRELGSSVSGLTSEQVSLNRSTHGPNKLKEKPKKTNLQRFFDQFKDAMILILLVAAASPL